MQKTSATGSQAIFHQRRSGVLLPITALPGSSQIKLEDNSERNGENSGENSGGNEKILLEMDSPSVSAGIRDGYSYS